MPDKLRVTIPCCDSIWWGPKGAGSLREERPFEASVLFLACLLATAFASQRGLHALLLARLQVKGVALDLLDNVFLLYLSLEATQGVLEGFTLLKPNFCQTKTPPDSSGGTGYLLQVFNPKSRGHAEFLDKVTCGGGHFETLNPGAWPRASCRYSFESFHDYSLD